MRRHCPQCGVDQNVADDRLSSGWIFLKCHQCGETSTLQGRASQALARLSEKPIRAKAAPTTPVVMGFSAAFSPEFLPVPGFLKEPGRNRKPLSSAAASARPDHSMDKPLAQAKRADSEPLLAPSPPSQVETKMAELIAATIAPENPSSLQFNMITEAGAVGLETPVARSALFSMPMSWLERDWKNIARANALTIILGAVCFGSGAYLLHTAKLLRAQGTTILPAEPREANTDLVKPQAPSLLVAAAAQPVSSAQGVAASAHDVASTSASMQEEAVTLKRTVNRSPAIVNRIDLPAPDGAEQGKSASPALPSAVRVMAGTAILRSGPGTAYPKVGLARSELQLMVKSAHENWFEVRAGHRTAWIRNDLVRPVNQVARVERSEEDSSGENP